MRNGEGRNCLGWDPAADGGQLRALCSRGFCRATAISCGRGWSVFSRKVHHVA